ncbi:guanine nucleotide-binding protein subunit alpha-11-like [Oppia nitens]|uniref:guanine nucleotide-binding protein subunit alpha-11-like n=1 Tax=Oppia nitens TaxID=1686743 RepID=UPI0023DBB39A|nr:guanine nucleotide-binding protein subunit alpha-11-like [Oppia nitens]
MDCCRSDESSLERKINKRIQIEIKKDKRNSRRQIKLLLLGTGESGKSTFIKQMRIIQEKDFSSAEKQRYICVIHSNILMAMESIVKAMVVLKISYQSPECHNYSQLFQNLDTNSLHHNKHHHLNNDLVEAIKYLWSDSGVQECYRRRNEYQLSDSAKYYIANVDRIASDSYLPTQQDILRARAPTNGINEYTFAMESIIFRLVDVGGQRSERRKWIHCFENVTSIIFICALSEFDQVLNECKNENRLQESMALFKTIVTCEWFHNSSVIIFFNKHDLFEEKMLSGVSHLNHYFQNYDGPDGDVISGRQFITNMFFDLLTDYSLKRIIYSYFTCATNTDNIRFVFKAVKDTIFELLLRKEIQIF